jgi:hypothetical protein
MLGHYKKWAYGELMKNGNTYNERNIFPHAMGSIWESRENIPKTF